MWHNLIATSFDVPNLRPVCTNPPAVSNLYERLLCETHPKCVALGKYSES